MPAFTGGILMGYYLCGVCDVAGVADRNKYVKPRCWRCGRFARRTYLYMTGPQSVKFEPGQGPVDPPYLTDLHMEESEDATSRSD